MFRTIVIPMVASFVLAMFVAVPPASAADTSATTITIEGMHCAGCAKKIATRLRAVAGVADAQVSAEAGSATITPKDKATLSSKSLWEAVETAGYTPTKLIGPTGTFTKKPSK